LFDLTGKVAVITGGAGLLGKEFAAGFASFGAKVCVAEIDEKRREAASEELKRRGVDVRTAPLDIADENSIERCLEKVIGSYGAVDVWVNNAYPTTQDWDLDFESIPASSWRENIDRHLNGYCFCCQKVGAQMKKQKKGSLINIASIHGILGPDFSVYRNTSMTAPAAYSVIKGGIVNFTRYLASYYGPYGVRVNTISPGGIPNHSPEPFVKNYSEKTPLRRMGRPNDVVGAAIYLASDASAYVTGHNLVVDGGWSVV